jgi:hypothetical protein
MCVSVTVKGKGEDVDDVQAGALNVKKYTAATVGLQSGNSP